jgi:hypothetical protein
LPQLASSFACKLDGRGRLQAFLQAEDALEPGGLVGSDEWEEFEATSVARPLLDGMRNEELAVGRGGFPVAVENPPPAKNCLARQLRTSTTDMRLSKMPVDSATSAAMTATVMTARITPYSAMV